MWFFLLLVLKPLIFFTVKGADPSSVCNLVIRKTERGEKGDSILSLVATAFYRIRSAAGSAGLDPGKYDIQLLLTWVKKKKKYIFSVVKSYFYLGVLCYLLETPKLPTTSTETVLLRSMSLFNRGLPLVRFGRERDQQDVIVKMKVIIEQFR